VQQGARVQAGNLVVPDAGVWAFQSKVGEVSPVIETEYAFFLFRLDSLAEAGTPALDDIRGSVEQAIRDEKKLVKAREVAEAYLVRVKGGEAMGAAATAMNLPNREMGPFPRVNPPLQNPAVVGAAFGLREGGLSGVIETEEGLYVIKSVKHVPADSAEFTRKIEEYRRNAVRIARQNRVRNYLDALRAAAKIEDNREELYEQARNQAATLPPQT
jgi:parvulin-like peptidyl-prolyl isomerase